MRFDGEYDGKFGVQVAEVRANGGVERVLEKGAMSRSSRGFSQPHISQRIRVGEGTERTSHTAYLTYLLSNNWPSYQHANTMYGSI